MSDREKTSLSFSVSLAKEVKKRGIDFDLDFSSSVEAACRAWLANPPEGSVPDTTAPVHENRLQADEELIRSIASIQQRSAPTAAALRALIRTLAREVIDASCSETPADAVGVALSALSHHRATAQASGRVMRSADKRSPSDPGSASPDKSKAKLKKQVAQ